MECLSRGSRALWPHLGLPRCASVTLTGLRGQGLSQPLSRCRALALRPPLSSLPVAGFDLRVLRQVPVGFCLNHRLPAMTFVSSSKRYHRVGHQMVPPLLRFPAFAPLSLRSRVSTPTTPVRPWFRRLDANPSVMFRPCGFAPLRRFTPHKRSEDIALQFRKGFVAFLDLRSLSARPRRNVFTLWIETDFIIPRNAVAPRSVSSPTAVLRLRSRCPLEVASRADEVPTLSCSLVITLDALLTDKVVLLDIHLGDAVSSFAVSRANECCVPRALFFKALLHR